MNHRTLFTLAVIAFSIQVAKADSQTERIRALAAENGVALTAGNHARVAELTYPKVVEMLGGADKLIEMLRRGTEEMKARGIAILNVEVSEPKQVVTSGNKQFAIVPMTMRMQMPNGTLRAKSFLIAISEDGGKAWTFIDGAGLVKEPGEEKDQLAKFLPDFPPELSLPAREEPVMEPK